MFSGCVDVNVTPDKRQILIQQERALLTVTKANLICSTWSNSKGSTDGVEGYLWTNAIRVELQSVNTPTASHGLTTTSHDPILTHHMILLTHHMIKIEGDDVWV